MRLSLSLFFVVMTSALSIQAKPPDVYPLFDKAVRAVVIAPDGKTVAAAGDEGQIALWDLQTRKVIHRFPGHKAGIEALTFRNKGKTLISGSIDGTLRWWDLEKRELQKTISAAGPVTDLSLSPDAKHLAVAFVESQTVQVLDAVSGKELRRLELPLQHALKGTNTSSRLTFSPDGSLLVASCGGRSWPKFIGGDSTISIWETEDWSLRTSFTAAGFILHELAISPDGQLLAAATNRDRKVKVWQIPPAKPQGKVDQPQIAKWIQQLNSKDFFERESAQQQLTRIGPAAKPALAEAAKSQSLEVRNRARTILKKLTQASLAPLYVLGVPRFDVHTTAFSPDGQWLALGRQFDRAGHVALFEMTKPPKRVVAPHLHGAWVVVFTPDSRKLITGRRDGHLTVWDIAP